jgi:protein phosphatase
MPRLLVAFKTEKSKDAPDEKDSFFHKDNLFIVAEGVNGDYLGEMLKEKVCSGLAASFFKHLSKERSPGTALVSALREINEEIIRERKRTGRKMAASVSAAYILGKVMYFSHLGDARLYCLHKGELVQLTKDHTVGEEDPLVEMTGVDRRLLRALTDGLGVREKPDIKVKTFALRKKDIILMTTEGLTRYLSNMQILKVSEKTVNPRDLSLRLLEEAKRKGAHDSMTLGIIRYQPFPQLVESKKGMAAVVLGLLILAVAGVYGKEFWPRHTPPEQGRGAGAQPSPGKTPPAPAPERGSGSGEAPKDAAPRRPQPAPVPGRVMESTVEAPGKAAPGHRQEVQDFLGEWKAAWEGAAGEKGDLERYLSLYAEDFSSLGYTKSAWRKEKGEINRRKSWIRVDLSDVHIGEMTSGNRVEVRFLQEYKSSNFSSSSKKVLLLRKTDTGWKITSERSA